MKTTLLKISYGIAVLITMLFLFSRIESTASKIGYNKLIKSYTEENTAMPAKKAVKGLGLPTTPPVTPISRPFNSSNPVGSTNASLDVTPLGAAIYNIPIVISPGTADVQPNPALTYSSQGGMGLLGYGWSISGLSAITRCGQTIYYDNAVTDISLRATDRFMLDGKRIVTGPVTYGSPGTIHSLEVEDFSTIVPYGTTGTGPTYFLVTKKDGTKIWYGNYDGTNAFLKSSNNSTIVAWYIARVEDRRGNYIKYNYQQDLTNGETWITTISYTGNASASITPYNTVEFTYFTGERDDKRVGYIAGCKFTNNKLINKIETKHNGNLLRKYVPKYYYDDFIKLYELEEYNASGEHFNSIAVGYGAKPSSLITGHLYPSCQARETGKEIYYGFVDFNNDGLTDFIRIIRTDELEERNFSWDVWSNLGSRFEKIQTGTFDFHDVNYFHFLPGDFNADGKPDIMVAVDYIGSYDRYFCFSSTGSNLSYSSQTRFGYDNHIYNAFSGDYDSDGQSEIIMIDHNDIAFYKYLNKNLTTQPTETRLELDIYDFKNFVADFNGDSKPEILSLQGSYFKVYKISSSSYNEVFSSTTINRINTTNMYPGDFNGDGKMDILKWKSGTGWQLYYFTGNSFVASAFPPSLPSIDMESSFDDHNLYLQDYNRDGRTDVLYVYKASSFNNFDMYFSTSGPFVKQSTTNTIFPYYDKSEVRAFGDFNGDGQPDVFCRPLTMGCPDICLIMGNDQSKLVNSIIQGTNVLSQITYTSIASPNNGVYTKGTGATHPLIDFQAPIFVAKTVTSSASGITIKNNSYTYAGAKAHKLGKGFLGFNKYAIIDNLTNDKTETVFLIKIIDNSYFYPYISSVTVSNGSSSKSQNYTAIDIETYSSCRKFYPYIKSQYEEDAIEDIKITDTYISYDQYYNPLKITREYKADDISTQGHGTVEALITTETTWLYNYLPSTIKVTSHRNGLADNIRNTSYSYTSNHLINIVKYDPGTAYEIWEDKDYDVCGNITQTVVKDKNGVVLRKMNFEFNDGKKRFLTKSINAYNHTEIFNYDQLNGNVTSTINTQGITTSYTYDGFGRRKTLVTPFGTELTEYIWNYSGGKYYIKWTGIDNSWKKEYYDEFGRLKKLAVSGFNGVELQQDISHNTKGQISARTEPYAYMEPIKSISYTYDIFGRLLSESSYRKNIIYSYTEPRKIVVTNGLQLNQIRWKKTNSLGEVVEAHDPGGSVKYSYNSAGNPVSIEAPGNLITTMQYDLAGNQISLDDPDAGLITYEYDLLGQLKKQTDEKGQIYSMSYDLLGRITSQQNSAEGTNTWTYVTSGAGIGQLSSVSNNLSGINHSYTFNGYGKVIGETENISGTSYSYGYSYDTKGRIAQITYPGNYFSIKNVYSDFGDLKKVTDGSGQKIWELMDVNSLGQIELLDYGNGTSTQYSYDTYHNPTEIKATGSGGVVQQLQYGFQYQTGNLNWRKDLLANGITENFTYDDLDRLKTTRIGTNPACSLIYNSDGSGRLTSKTDIGNYNYSIVGGGIPHAPTTITNSDGNVIGRTLQNLTYTPFQKASTISEGTKILNLVYGPEHQRKKTELSNSGTLVKRKIFAGDLYELEEDNSGNKRHLFYVPGPGGIAAIFEKRNMDPVTPYYIHKDYQGSYQTITNSSGDIAEVLSFDAWGRRRNPVNWSYINVPASFLFDRGYTGHEHLDDFSLINMNGRIFDPLTIHFLSPDNYISDPTFTQSYHRYSYCLNNPLKFTDPSGQFPWLAAGIGAVIGAYLGGAAANGWQFNPFKWDWGSGDTYLGIGIGFVIGAAAALGIIYAAPYVIEFLGGLGFSSASSTIAGYTITGFVAGGLAGYPIGLFGGLLYSNGDWSYANQSGIFGMQVGATIGSAAGAIAGTIVAINDKKKLPKPPRYTPPILHSPPINNNVNARVDLIRYDDPAFEVGDITAIPNYYNNALAYEEVPYCRGGLSVNGLDCSGLMHVSAGVNNRVWTTAMGAPPFGYDPVNVRTSSYADFLADVQVGDVFLWDGHTAYYAGGNNLFHAHGGTGTPTGFTSDLVRYYLPYIGFPQVFRMNFNPY